MRTLQVSFLGAPVSVWSFIEKVCVFGYPNIIILHNNPDDVTGPNRHTFSMNDHALCLAKRPAI